MSIVFAGGIVVVGYAHSQHAHMHAKTITGASVVNVEILDTLPENVRDDIAQDQEWEDEEDTPVVDKIEAVTSSKEPPDIT